MEAQVLGGNASDIVAAGQALQQVKTTYQTAVAIQRPRDLAAVERRCLLEATIAGERLFYGWGSGNNRVEGPSIECAMIMIRNWGNCAGEMLPMEETPTSYIFNAAFVDLETGVTVTRQFRQSKKWTIYGKFDDERKDDIRFQIGQSKALRNVVLRTLPSWLSDKMMEKAKEGVREKLEAYIKTNGIEKARDLTRKSLAKYGVTEERVTHKYGKKYAEWDVELLILLKGDLQALSTGAESTDALFPDPQATAPTTGSLNPEDMKAGDAKSHQPHPKATKASDDAPGEAKETSQQPTKAMRCAALRDEIEQLEKRAMGDNVATIRKYREKNDLNIDLDHPDIAEDEVALSAYHAHLVELPAFEADKRAGKKTGKTSDQKSAEDF